MILGALVRKRLGNEQNGTGFIRVSWERLHVGMQSRKCDFHHRKYKLFEERESASRNAYKHIAFWMNFGAFLRKALQNDQ